MIATTTELPQPPLISLDFALEEEQSTSKEKEVFNKTILTEKQDEANPSKPTVAKIDSSDSSHMLETKEKTETAVKPQIAGQKRTQESLGKAAEKELRKVKKTKTDSTFIQVLTSLEKNQPITIENLGLLIEGKTPAEIVGILNQANQLLPDKWLDKLDLPTKILLASAQYENKDLTLTQLCNTINELLGQATYDLLLEEDIIVLRISPNVKQHNYAVLTALSQIKALQKVFLDTTFFNYQIDDIDFPYVRTVVIGSEFGRHCLYPLNLAKLFPNAEHYCVRLTCEFAEGLRTMLDKLPSNLSRLTCYEPYTNHTSFTVRVMHYMRRKFKNLKGFEWTNRLDGKAISVFFPDPLVLQTTKLTDIFGRPPGVPF